jgi:enoyl-CoA hydratase
VSDVADPVLLVEPTTDEGVATLVLNRPAKRNALSIELRDALSDALDALAGDERVRCIVVTGAGTTFSAGFDLGEFAVDEPGFQERLWASSDRFHHAVLGCPVPTVAAVNGPALAGGFDLAVLCDLRVVARSARFAHPEVTFGPVVYGPLRELVGGGVARDLVLTGREVGADEALRLGLATSVVDDADVRTEAARVASAICRAPREQLLGTVGKIRRRTGIDGATPTLDL